MADEQDRLDAAGGDGTALVTEPGAGPVRPTGKRSRQRAAAGDGADASADTEVIKTGGRAGRKAKRGADEPSRNPFVFVYNYLQQVAAELRKVIWPNRKQMVTYTSVVFAFLVFMTALIFGADVAFARLVMLVFGD